MPNRIIREAILSSEKMAMLSWAEEVFYRRLLSIVDDHGRYEANPQLLRSKCYPLHTDATVQAKDIAAWLVACQRAGVLQSYTVGNKRYLQVLNFGQQQRTPSKYPEPPADASNCEQTIGNGHLGVSVFGGVVEGVVVVGGATFAPPPPAAAASPVLEPDSQPPAPKPKKVRSAPAVHDEGEEEAPTNPLWRAYSSTFFEVHGVEPVREKSVNVFLKTLLERLGKDEAPQVIAYYVRDRDQWYMKKMHPLELLVKEWQGMRARWLRDRQGLPDPALAMGLGLNKQEALEASNRAVVHRMLAKEATP